MLIVYSIFTKSMITVTTKKDITVDHQYREVPMEVIGFGEKEINMYNLMKIGILV